MTMTRRAFIGGVAAVVPAGLLARQRTPAGPLPIGIETWSFHDVDLRTMLEHVRALGVDHLELHDGHLPRTATADQIASARTMLADARIAATGVYIHDA